MYPRLHRFRLLKKDDAWDKRKMYAFCTTGTTKEEGHKALGTNGLDSTRSVWEAKAGRESPEGLVSLWHIDSPTGFGAGKPAWPSKARALEVKSEKVEAPLEMILPHALATVMPALRSSR